MNSFATSTTLQGVAIAGREGRFDLDLCAGRIASVSDSPSRQGGLVLPLFSDAHVHLDKTFVAHRLPRHATTLLDAIEITAADRVRWDAEDIRCRATQALHRAYAYGTGRMRSHVDWTEPETPVAWSVLNELRTDWQERVALQLAALVNLDLFPEAGESIAERVAADGGVLGAFVYRNADLRAKVSLLFDLAERHDLALDFHVDEALEPESQGIDAIVAEAAARGFGRRVLVGHCCSLSVRPFEVVQPLLERLGAAEISLCVLPTTNAALQDRSHGRTPRYRGIAPLHEAHAAGIPVFLASDNCRDAFYPWGDYDLWDVFRTAIPMAHLEPASWIGAITDGPAAVFDAVPEFRKGAAADFILFDAESIDDAVSRPLCRRQVWRDGAVVPPDPSLGKPWT